MKVTDVLTQKLALKVTDVLTHPGKRHGNLKLDGCEAIEFFEYPKHDPDFAGMKDHFCIVTGQEVDVY